jgi:DNA/RNA-binding domain of Phe-tRNA-synthetase-like protein
VIFEYYPGLHIAVAVADSLDNAAERPAVAARWREVWEAAGREAAPYGNAQSHPRVQPWRTHFQALGVSGKKFPSSIEALLRRALKGDPPFSINPLVDWYNTVSLRHTAPAGGFDLDQLRGPLELRLTRAGDAFTALDEESPVEVPLGEVAYTDGSTVLTRQFMWRQAREGLLTPATRSVIVVSEIPGEAGAELAETVRVELESGLRDEFGVTPRTFVVDRDRPTVAW